MPLDDDYLVWLYSQVGSVKTVVRTKTYWSLFRLLYKKEFTWSEGVAKDENRAEDGKNLRREFLRETNRRMDEPGWLDFGCSMLELLIALAWKMEFEGDSTQERWFWELIENLGLTECNDANPPDAAIIDHILNKVINRDYAPNGAGGLFPLKDPDQDQREVELWYQLNAYLLERL